MITMSNIIESNNLQNCRGFSLLEILFGMTVFMIGMLGVIALNISSLKSNTFSGNMSEAVIIAGDTIEELMTLDFDHAFLDDTDGDGTGEDLLPDLPGQRDGDGVDDDGGNFGLDDTGADADNSTPGVGKNGIYTVYWNVAVDEPLPEKTKTVTVIVEWAIKDVKRQVKINNVVLMKKEG